MRILAAFLLLLFAGKCAWADVVVSNIGLTSTSALLPDISSITFTPTQTGTFGTVFTIKVKNQTGATGDLSVLRFTFSEGTGYLNGTLVGGVPITAGNYGEFQFNLGNISYSSGVVKTLTFKLNAQSTGSIVNWATAATGIYSGAWGSGASAGVTNGMYSVAVPEPGTMALGGMLAGGSLAGWWWRRRKQVELPG